VIVEPGESGLRPASRVLLNQLRTIDKQRLERYIGQLDANSMARVDQAISISIGLKPL